MMLMSTGVPYGAGTICMEDEIQTASGHLY